MVRQQTSVARAARLPKQPHRAQRAALVQGPSGTARRSKPDAIHYRTRPVRRWKPGPVADTGPYPRINVPAGPPTRSPTPIDGRRPDLRRGPTRRRDRAGRGEPTPASAGRRSGQRTPAADAEPGRTTCPRPGRSAAIVRLPDNPTRAGMTVEGVRAEIAMG